MQRATSAVATAHTREARGAAAPRPPAMCAGSTKVAAPTVILKMAAASPRPPITRRRAGPGAVASGTNEIEELRKVDIAAGDNGHDRARTGLAGERSREAERASSLGDDTRPFRH